ncbi:hypothetical protein ABTX34_25885 [Streptomyces sp. NPDC096538]|uniref:hypothetical protein n=1 Tax=Streptomyces sp. NPDC096538 TaxID=3155427 RepID=UPI0033308E7F
MAVESEATAGSRVCCLRCYELDEAGEPHAARDRVAKVSERRKKAYEVLGVGDGRENSPVDSPDQDEVLLIGAFDPGEPHDVLVTGSGITWTFVLREHHLEHAVCPLPAEAAPHLRRATVVRLHDGRAWPTVLLDVRRKKAVEESVSGVRWSRAQVMPGTWITAELSKGQLELRVTPLARPVFIARRKFLHAYDPQVVVRELPVSSKSALDAPLDRAVLETIRKLGYLDERGRALLPVANLIANVGRLHGHGRPVAVDAVRAALDRLVNSKHLTWQTGSRSVEGFLAFPARRGEKKIRLVCYQPFELPRGDQKPHRVVHLPGPSLRHGVSGHLMKIDHLGKEASEEARAAYAEAHRRAGLAGSHKLPKGHTYVRPHERGGR